MDPNLGLKLSHVNDVPEKGAIIVPGPDISIALFKLNGQIYALENECPHMGGPLGKGLVEEGLVTSPWHGWQFDIREGTCQNMPGDDAKKLAISVHDGAVYLDI